jgi:hypothetical protein
MLSSHPLCSTDCATPPEWISRTVLNKDMTATSVHHHLYLPELLAVRAPQFASRLRGQTWTPQAICQTSSPDKRALTSISNDRQVAGCDCWRYAATGRWS